MQTTASEVAEARSTERRDADVAPYRRGGTPLLECRGVCKQFGAVQALADVDFEVFAGEVVALVGDNGAGKSTLIKAISGIQPADRGVIRFKGREVDIRVPADATRLGIATVYQDLALCDNLDTVANLFLGREMVGPPGTLSHLHMLAEPEMEQRADEQLHDLRVTTIESVHSPVAVLSGGQRQAVAVARATLWDAELVILDEPTAALGVTQTAIVLELIKQLRTQGLGVIVISHNIEVVFDVADRIVVLYVGRNAAVFEQASTTREAVIGAIIGLAPAQSPRAA